MPRLALLALAIANLAHPLDAAEFTLRAPEPITMIAPFGRSTMEGASLGASEWTVTPAFHIHMSGPIEAGDANKLEELFFENAQGLPFHYGILSLDSGGGNFREGLALGDFIYGWSLNTFVFAGDTCLSACALAFMAGSDEAIRGVLKQPAKYVEVGADLGFHAPFLEEDVVRAFAAREMSGDGNDEDNAVALAKVLFDSSREMTREINRRIERWGVAPSLVSEFLGYGPDEFYRIDTQVKARRSEISVFGRQIHIPRDLTYADAIGACEFKLYSHLGHFYDNSSGFLMVSDGDASQVYPAPFLSGRLGAWEPSAAEVLGDRAVINSFVPGRGNFSCQLVRTPDGSWTVDAQGDIHPDRVFGEPLRNTGPVQVNEFMIAGPSWAWTEDGYDHAIRDYVSERLRLRFPDEFGQAVQPSYSCDDVTKLNNAERLICETPTLAHLDSVMAREYVQARDENDQARAFQADWFRARGAICQTERAELEIEIARVNQLRCLAGAMISQIELLKARRFE